MSKKSASLNFPISSDYMINNNKIKKKSKTTSLS